MRIGRQQERRERQEQHGQQVRLGKALVVGGCVAALGFAPSAAVATPGSGVSGTVVAKGTSTGKLKVKTPRGRTDVTFRTITVEPGGSTGWHTHSGQLIAVVKSGTLTRTLDDCSVEVTPAGTSFIEPAGAHHRHIGRNLGTEPVVLWVTYLLPEGSALSDDADAVDCGAKK
ncbi:MULTISPECIES: cupin domain-containing protein [Streptomyces]|jgi:quercetin dioxygenase-like cupin family protein|uniref:cupin domain-containing protein n=1 Tax=unclassified Streptomyces TaxID=2593676 RepID=UPI00068A5083|nr:MULTISPECIES: cupin domain-containing protein [unclassified Streptomyces]MDX2729314.1 cupin domain-containing protein [Streptomyces sp. PA03-2a]MDX3768221.1 cupin domain-containing protein [Streptomyces sp. AK08-01B]MDX3817513.1 cupin domain-containing protein [Streptomyces sp. AK08-01A]WSQ30164.1 cupin domain-containing protein [Streptomyces sp. NBC_01230]SCY28307.1 Cupin domain-containing protein [Streptomyces sp. 136MFCol5.1]